MVAAFLSGFALMGSLVVVLGAQGAFVLRQGMLRQRHLMVAAICSACDAGLIGLGVWGAEALVADPQLSRLAMHGAVAYLLLFGAFSLRSAVRGGTALEATPVGGVVRTALAVSLLNPHVWLDSVVLMGTLSTAHEGPARAAFGVGAACATWAWYGSLSLAAARLAPWLRAPRTRRALDLVMALAVWGMAAWLLVEGASGTIGG